MQKASVLTENAGTGKSMETNRNGLKRMKAMD